MAHKFFLVSLLLLISVCLVSAAPKKKLPKVVINGKGYSPSDNKCINSFPEHPSYYDIVNIAKDRMLTVYFNANCQGGSKEVDYREKIVTDGNFKSYRLKPFLFNKAN